MTKLLISIGLCLAANMRAWAQTDEFDLREILTRSELLQGAFTQIQTIPGLRSNPTSHGKFFYAHSHGLLWITEQPNKSTTLFTNEGAFDKSSNQAHRLPKSAQRISSVILQVLSADILHDTQFTATLQGDIASWNLSLQPRQKVLQRHLATIELAGSEVVQSIRLVAKDGSNTQISFTDVIQLTTPSLDTCRLLNLTTGLCGD